MLYYTEINCWLVVSFNEKTLDKYDLAILRKMFNHGYIGGRRTEDRSILSGFPKHDLRAPKKIFTETDPSAADNLKAFN